MSANIFCAGVSLLLNILMSVLLFHKAQKERGKLIFGGFTLYMAANNVYYLFRNAHIHTYNEDVFSFSVLAVGFFVIAAFLVFPLEVLLPPRFNKPWLLPLFCVPSILFDTAWVLLCRSGMQVLRLTDARHILGELNNASVLFRLVLFGSIMLFFIFSILFMVWAHKRYMTDKILRIYAYSTIPVMFIYVAILYYGLTPAMYMLHTYYVISFNAFITFLLLTSRNAIEIGKSTQTLENEIQRNVLSSPESKNDDLMLLHQLDLLMKKEKAYCSSDLTLPDLARMLGTNRTRLSELIRCKGYTNFTSYLNTYRMEEFIRLMQSGEAEKISDATTAAGFGSKSSFYRCFVATYSSSPAEYLKQLQTPESTSR
ncbi:MAG: AraC family transcriptional regulator [Bacteroides sp.]